MILKQVVCTHRSHLIGALECKRSGTKTWSNWLYGKLHINTLVNILTVVSNRNLNQAGLYKTNIYWRIKLESIGTDLASVKIWPSSGFLRMSPGLDFSLHLLDLFSSVLFPLGKLFVELGRWPTTVLYFYAIFSATSLDWQKVPWLSLIVLSFITFTLQ